MADFSKFGSYEVGVYRSVLYKMDGRRGVLRCWTTMLSEESSLLVACDQVEINPFVPVYVARSYPINTILSRGVYWGWCVSSETPHINNQSLLLPSIKHGIGEWETCH